MKRKAYFTAYVRSRNKFRNMCKAKRQNVERKRRQELLLCRNRPGLFWQHIKQVSKPRIYDEEITSSEWFEYFSMLFNRVATDYVDINTDILENIRVDTATVELDEPITEEEIVRSVSSLRGSCSPGNDGITMDMFKTTLTSILPYLKMLYNRVLNTGEFPPEWSESVITPVFKKGKRNEPNNYREFQS